MAELVYDRDFTQVPIEQFLRASGGDLADVSVTVAGRRQPFGKAILGQTLYYSVSPKIILALLEYQSDLVTQPGLPAERYQWALGNYREDGRYAGFSAQIRWAVRELFYARRDLRERPPLVYADGRPFKTAVSNQPYCSSRRCTNGCLGHFLPNRPPHVSHPPSVYSAHSGPSFPSRRFLTTAGRF